MLARARNAQAHFYFEKMMEVAFDSKDDFFVEGDKVVGDHVRVARHRLIVDTLKFAASKLLPRTYGEKPEEPPASPLLQVTKIERVILSPTPAPDAPEPPRQIAYQPPEPPADLSTEAWGHILQISELIKRIAPGDETPEHVFGLIEGWLREHYLSA
jgi:hypothetical protein